MKHLEFQYDFFTTRRRTGIRLQPMVQKSVCFFYKVLIL